MRTTLKRPLFKPFLMGRACYRGQIFTLAKPLTFMNRCGQAIREILRAANSGIEEMLVICDSLDLPPGECRLKRKGSAGGHKGLLSLISSLGSSEFMRLTIGIGRPESREEVTDYVLSQPRGEEARLLEEALFTAAASVLRLLEEEPEKVMNALNQRKGDD